MVMFLMALCLSMFGVAVTCVAFAAATAGERRAPDASLDQKAEKVLTPALALALAPPRFFAGDTAVPVTQPRVPIEVLLLQIERHVRLEQAAAESFLEYPTPESLHSRTMSPLVH